MTKGVFDVLDRILVEMRIRTAAEARLVNELACEIARMKANPATPENVVMAPKCPSCGVFHSSEECNTGRWWVTCPFCGWWHQDDTAVVDVLDGTGIPAQCRCLKCSRHWNERTEGEPEPSPTPEPWWKVCPRCGSENGWTIAQWENGAISQRGCHGCGNNWRDTLRKETKPEPSPEPPPWWKTCPWCLWEHIKQSAILTANVGEGVLVCVCRKCGKAWKHSDVET